MNEPIGYIYETTCLVNGKTYIGLRHYSRDIGREWNYYLGSGSLVKSAISKYGCEKFSKRMIVEAFTEEELQSLEWDHIQAAKDIGKAEYNLFRGPGAGGDTFSRLTPEKLSEVRQKQSIGIRNHQAKEGNGYGNHWKSLYSQFFESQAENVRESYERLGSVKAVAQELKTYPKWVRRVLSDIGVTVLSFNERSASDRRRSSDDYRRTTETLLIKRLTSGVTPLEIHDKNLGRLQEIHLLRKNLSRNDLATKFSVSTTWLDRFLRDHGLSSRNTPFESRTDCRKCSISNTTDLSTIGL